MLFIGLIAVTCMLGLGFYIARSSGPPAGQPPVEVSASKNVAKEASSEKPDLKVAFAELGTETFRKRVLTAGSGPVPKTDQYVTVDAGEPIQGVQGLA